MSEVQPVSVLHTRVVTATGGGPDKTILLGTASLAHTRYRVTAAYLHPSNDPGFDILRRRARSAGCQLVSVPDRGPFDLAPARALLDVCRRLDVRVWHGHDYKSNFLGLVLRPFHPMHLVSTVHGWVTYTRRTPLYYAIDAASLRRYDHVFCVSDDLLGRVRALGVPARRTMLLRNAVDTRLFRPESPPAASMLRTRLGVPAGRLIFGALGRLNEEKGFSVLVEAAARLIGRGLDIEVWIAGDGPQRSALESQVRGYNIMDRVRFLGFWEQTLDLYAALDGFVLSSVREGLPNVLLEAMAMQIPVVSTRVPGVLELIQDGENGLLVGIRDAAGLADAMARLAVDSALRSRLGAAGRARVEADFDFRRRADIERAAYDRLLMNRSAKHAQWRPTCSALSD